MEDVNRVMARVKEQHTHRGYPKSAQIREWVGIGLGIIGTVLAALGYQEAVRSRERSTRVEAYVYLDTAWDLMDGQPGTSLILHPVKDSTKLEEARRAIERSLVLEPDNERAFRVKASYLRAMDKPRDAIRSLETARDLKPDEFRTYAALGLIYIDLGDLPRAEGALSKAVSLEPADYNSLTNLGVASTRQRRYEKALEYYNRALKLAPKFEGLYNLKGADLRKLGRETEALMCFWRAAELRKDSVLMDKLMQSIRARTHNRSPIPSC